VGKYRVIIAGAAAALLVAGCAGQIAKTGCAKIVGVGCGVMTLQYEDGKRKLKRIDPGNLRKGSRTALKNLGKPGKYVETTQGSTLTFPCGDTMNYYEDTYEPKEE
jgi:hypothetical protein